MSEHGGVTIDRAALVGVRIGPGGIARVTEYDGDRAHGELAKGEVYPFLYVDVLLHDPANPVGGRCGPHTPASVLERWPYRLPEKWLESLLPLAAQLAVNEPQPKALGDRTGAQLDLDSDGVGRA